MVAAMIQRTSRRATRVRQVAIHLSLFSIFSCAVVLASTSAFAGTREDLSNIKRDMNRIEHEITNIQRDLSDLKEGLQEIKELLKARDRVPLKPFVPPIAEIRVMDSPALGRPDAPLTLIDFSDYQCLICQRFYEETLPLLREDFIETGQVRYMVRDFPVERLHPQAKKMAVAAHCAQEQGRFWEMHELLFQHQQALGFDNLKEYAGQLGLNETEFQQCLEAERAVRKIGEDMDTAKRAGVLGTPTYLLGKTTKDRTISGQLLRGAQSYTLLKRTIQELLRRP